MILVTYWSYMSALVSIRNPSLKDLWLYLVILVRYLGNKIPINTKRSL
jgi:hypothetical protein